VFAYASPKAHGAGAYITDGRQFSLVTCHYLEETNTTTTGPHGSIDLCQASQFYPSCPQANISSSPDPALQVKLWSESEIVLHWPHSNKPLIPFMTNRTEEIKKLFPTSHWNQCPITLNHADLLTRGINAHSYINHLYGNVGRRGDNLSHIGPI